MAFDLNFIFISLKLDLQVELEQEDCNLRIAQCLRLLVITEIWEYHEYEKIQVCRLGCECLRNGLEFLGDMSP